MPMDYDKYEDIESDRAGEIFAFWLQFECQQLFNSLALKPQSYFIWEIVLRIIIEIVFLAR